MRLAIVYGLSRKWRAAKVDVRTAFLQTESQEELYLKMPKDLPDEAKELGYEPGGVYPMLKAVYGRIDSARLFTTKFKTSAGEIDGWRECSESILVHSCEGERDNVDGLLIMHMDDLLCFSKVPKPMLKNLGTKFKMGEIEELQEDKSTVYTGMDMYGMRIEGSAR